MLTKSNSKQLDLFREGKDASRRATTDLAEPFVLCTKCIEQYLSDRQVALRFDVSKATIWRWHNQNPEFPRRIKLSKGTSRWRLSDLVKFEMSIQAEGLTYFAEKANGRSR